MAIKYYERYPQRWESPSQDYPQGAFKNLSALGEQDGSYLEEAWLNDQSGFFGALLRNAEMTPNGLVDTAQRSQFYEALLVCARKAVDLSGYYTKAQVDAEILANKTEVVNEWGDGVDAVLSQGFVTKNLGYTKPDMFLGDDSSKIEQATIYAYNNNTYVLCDREYTIDRALKLYPCVVKGGVFKLTTASSEISFTLQDKTNVTQGFVDSDFKIEVITTNVITTPQHSNNYITNRITNVFSNLKFFGSTKNLDSYAHVYNEYALNYITIGDCVGCFVDNIVITGGYDIKVNPELQPNINAITTRANGAVLSMRARNIEISGCKVGFNIGQKTFYTLSNFDIIGAYEGIIDVNQNNLNEPKLFSGNINAQKTGIHVKGSASRDINNITIRRHREGFKDPTYDYEWNGIILEDCNDFNCSENILHIDEGNGVFNHIKNGIKLINSSLFSVKDNFISTGIDNGIVLDNCTGFNVNGTITAQNLSSMTIIKLVNNTRNFHIGSSRLVSSFTGTEISLDSTIKSGVYYETNKGTYYQNGQNETRVKVGNLDRRHISSKVGEYYSFALDGGVFNNHDIINLAQNNREFRYSAYIHANTPEFRVNHAPVIVSDERKKTDIESIDSNVYKVLQELSVKTFKLNGSDMQTVGVMAQDWVKLCTKYNVDIYYAGVLAGDEDGYFVRYENLHTLYFSYILSKIR